MSDPFAAAEAEKRAADQRKADEHAVAERMLEELFPELLAVQDRLREYKVTFEWGYRGFMHGTDWVRSEPTSRCILLRHESNAWSGSNAITVLGKTYYADGGHFRRVLNAIGNWDNEWHTVSLGNTPAEAVENIVRSVVLSKHLPALGYVSGQKRFMDAREFRRSKTVGSGCAIPLAFVIGCSAVAGWIGTHFVLA